EGILRAVPWIVARTPVARRDIQVAIGTEFQRTAVVIDEWLGEMQQFHGRCGIGTIGIRCANAIARNHGRTVSAARVVHEEIAVIAKAWMKGESEKPLLAAELNERCHVEKRRCQQLSVLRDANTSGLLDDKEPSAAIARVRDVRRILQSRYRGEQVDQALSRRDCERPSAAERQHPDQRPTQPGAL